jgi:hypothetical protein
MKTPQNLLIVGDWVMDDNWQTGIHRSSTSLRTGQRHHRALHPPGKPVQAFCGVGRLASILHDARAGDAQFDPLFVVHGLGVWKHDEKGNDTKLLESMFDFNFRSTQGPFSLHSSPSDAQSAPQNVHLFNLATFLSRPNVPDKPGIAAIHKTEYFTTTRAYRVFQRRGNKLSLLARTDWEHPPRSRDGKGAPEWIVNEDFDAFGAFLDECELTNNEKRPIHGVIIKDLIKGVSRKH